MIRSYINSTRNCGVVLNLEMFSHLFDRSFGLSSFVGFGYLSLTQKKKRKNEANYQLSLKLYNIT